MYILWRATFSYFSFCGEHPGVNQINWILDYSMTPMGSRVNHRISTSWPENHSRTGKRQNISNAILTSHYLQDESIGVVFLLNNHSIVHSLFFLFHFLSPSMHFLAPLWSYYEINFPIPPEYYQPLWAGEQICLPSIIPTDWKCGRKKLSSPDCPFTGKLVSVWILPYL